MMMMLVTTMLPMIMMMIGVVISWIMKMCQQPM